MLSRCSSFSNRFRFLLRRVAFRWSLYSSRSNSLSLVAGVCSTSVSGLPAVVKLLSLQREPLLLLSSLPLPPYSGLSAVVLLELLLSLARKLLVLFSLLLLSLRYGLFVLCPFLLLLLLSLTKGFSLMPCRRLWEVLVPPSLPLLLLVVCSVGVFAGGVTTRAWDKEERSFSNVFFCFLSL